jgi:hypothetical protein
MCQTAIRSDPQTIQFVKDQFLTREICLSPDVLDEVMLPITFRFINEEYRTPDLCRLAVKVHTENL